MFEERQIEMLPQVVDQRLAGWRLAGRRDQSARLARTKGQDIQAEFLAATKLPCLSSHVHPSASSPQVPHIHEAMPLVPPFRHKVLKYPDLPLDVILEIAAYVHPLDIIYLSQTSRQLRRLFMSKASRTTWKIVLGDIPELPPCPDDMCEPLYAALVFGKYCFGCGAEDAFWTDYALRLRMCEACYKANVVEGKEVLKSLPEDSLDWICDILLMLVPSANNFNFTDLDESFDRINPLYHLQEDFYFKPELEAMLGVLWPVPASEDIAHLEELIKIRANYVMMRQMHAVLIHAWDNVGAVPSSEPDFFRIKSEYQYVESLQVFDCDWDEVCAPVNPVFSGYLSGQEFEENGRLRLHRDPPKSHTQLAAERLTLEHRETVARDERIRVRRAQVDEWCQDIMNAHPHLPADERPNAHDTARLWAPVVCGRGGDAREPLDEDTVLGENYLRAFILTPLIAYRLRAVRCLAAEVEQYERRRAEDLAARRSNVKGKGRRRSGAQGLGMGMDAEADGEPWTMGWQVDPKALLARPTALFACRECGALPYAFPDINVHWQEAHPDKSAWMGACVGFGGVGQYGAEVWEEGAEVAERILKVLVKKGLEEDERDIEALDELVREGRVFCACGDPTMATSDFGEEELGWETLVDHVFNHLNDNMLRKKTSPRSESNDGPVWLDDHNLASCIRYLPDDADTSEADVRVAADESTRERVNTLLRQCPETSSPACRLCDALTPDNLKDDSLFLTANADAIVYHMRAKHGKNFEEEDVVFWDKSVFDKP